MLEIKVRVTREEYLDWKSRSEGGDNSWKSEFADRYVDEAWRFGYGFYGCRIGAEEGTVIGLKGETCD